MFNLARSADSAIAEHAGKTSIASNLLFSSIVPVLLRERLSIKKNDRSR
ncbi:hypothetical protein SDC49_09630 [Lactobacillus sp. R2/2]|nr:hypothetical protein [Lactobacillus sp. R2/2]